MKNISHIVVLVLAAGVAVAAEPEQKVLESTLPATSLEREENNPAKAAVAAREALRRDERARAEAAMTALKADQGTVAANVTRALKESTDLRAGEVTVSTEVGAIILTGQVNTAAEREVAGAIAQRAAGDVRVTNRVEVRPAADPSDR